MQQSMRLSLRAAALENNWTNLPSLPTRANPALGRRPIEIIIRSVACKPGSDTGDAQRAQNNPRTSQNEVRDENLEKDESQ